MKQTALLMFAALSVLPSCIHSDDDDDATDSGTMHLSWTITSNDEPVASCAIVGAVEVEVLTTGVDGVVVADQFPCDNWSGTTFALAPGSYTVQIDLLDGDDQVLQSTPIETGIPVTADEITELGTYAFAFEGPGATVTASVHVDYGPAGGSPTDNCDTDGGQAVVQQEIWISDAGSQTCLDLTITNPFGTGDACGGRLVCTNAGESNTIELPPGDYEVQILGFRGAVGDETFLCFDSGRLPFSIAAGARIDVAAPFVFGDPRCGEL
jgi:hypothetical protein